MGAVILPTIVIPFFFFHVSEADPVLYEKFVISHCKKWQGIERFLTYVGSYLNKNRFLRQHMTIGFSKEKK